MEEKLSLLDPSKAQGDRPRATYNTGAKGVLADRNAAASAARQARRATVAEQNDRLERATLNTQTWDHEERQRAAEAAEAAPRRRSASSDGRISPSMDEEGSQEQEDMEYIMARDARRAQRLAELRGGPAASEDESCLETVEFGHLREIDPLTYADVIDNTPPDVNVIIHLYSRVRSFAYIALASASASTSKFLLPITDLPRCKPLARTSVQAPFLCAGVFSKAISPRALLAS